MQDSRYDLYRHSGRHDATFYIHAFRRSLYGSRDGTEIANGLMLPIFKRVGKISGRPSESCIRRRYPTCMHRARCKPRGVACINSVPLALHYANSVRILRGTDRSAAVPSAANRPNFQPISTRHISAYREIGTSNPPADFATATSRLARILRFALCEQPRGASVHVTPCRFTGSLTAETSTCTRFRKGRSRFLCKS